MTADLLEIVARSASAIGIDEALIERARIERPAQKDHGDWSSNVALVAAKAMKTKPRDLAQRIADSIEQQAVPWITKVEVAGPGFVNFYLSNAWLHEIIGAVLAEGTEYGR